MFSKNNIEIKDFGSIKQANIDISPLTIFIGPNGSGKSFSSLLIYSFINAFDEINLNIDLNRIPTYSFNELLKNNLKLYEEFSNKLNNYISSKPQFNDDAFRYPLDKFNDLIYYGFGSCYKKLINNKINSVFADNLNKLNNINSNSFEISFNGNHFIRFN